MMLHGIARHALVALLPALAACVSLPLPLARDREVTGREVTNDELRGFRIGHTTREEIESTLGEPAVDWAAERTLAYGWTSRRARYALSSRASAPLVVDRVDEGRRRHGVAFQFDPGGRLLRMESMREAATHPPAPGLHE